MITKSAAEIISQIDSIVRDKMSLDSVIAKLELQLREKEILISAAIKDRLEECKFSVQFTGKIQVSTYFSANKPYVTITSPSILAGNYSFKITQYDGQTILIVMEGGNAAFELETLNQIHYAIQSVVNEEML